MSDVALGSASNIEQRTDSKRASCPHCAATGYTVCYCGRESLIYLAWEQRSYRSGMSANRNT